MDTKHELLHYIKTNFQKEAPSHFDAKVSDGAATVQTLPIDNTEMTPGAYNDCRDKQCRRGK